MSSTQTKPKGWGSFMTEQTDEKVEVLINKSEEEYIPPKLPIDTNIDHYPVCGPAGKVKPEGRCTIAFGDEAKKHLFYLDPSFTFLNHGAFGAALKPVIEVSRRWQEHMESQPLRFIDRELLPLLVYTVRQMAKFVHCEAKDIVLVPNATTALNSIFRGLSLNEGDHILCLDTGYGATKKMLQYITSRSNAIIDELPVTFPVAGDDEIVALVRAYLRKMKKSGQLSKIRLAVFDMINSNSAIVLPVQRLCELCSEFGVETLVDGAHALGSMALDIPSIGCCYFTANAHKWLCSAKGAALLYVRADKAATVVPAIISHGHGGGSLISEFIWQGLMDYGPWLSLLTVLEYWRKVGVNTMRAYIHNTVRNAAEMLMEMWGTDALADGSMFGPMWCVRLPGPRVPRSGKEAVELQEALYHLYQIECPVKHLQNRLYVRISAHIHNKMEDFEKLGKALLELRPRLSAEEDAKDKEDAENAALVKQEGGCGMLGSNASAVHVIGSQIEAMTMRVEEIKRKGITDTQKFNNLKKRRAQQDVEISQLKSRLEDIQTKESEARAKLHAAEARKNAHMEFIQEHEERSRQGKEAVEAVRVAALKQRRHYIEQMQESSTNFLTAAADCDKENLARAINSLQITLDARRKAQEEQKHPAHRAKVAKLAAEVAQMREHEKSLLQEVDREKARMDASKHRHDTFTPSLLQASMGVSAKKLECHAPSPPPGVLYQTHEVDWKGYRASIRSVQHTLQDLWRNASAKNEQPDHGGLEEQNAERIANVSWSLEALCVSTLRHHANEALAVAVSPNDAYNVLLHELDKLCRLYVALHVEKERREHLGRGEQRDSEADIDLSKDNSLISSFSFGSEITDEMKEVIFDPYAVADEDNTISPYHRQMRAELAELLKQARLYGYHGDATPAPHDVEALSFDGPTPYGEFNALGMDAQFGADGGDTVLTSWTHNQFETVEMEIAALFSCMVENDDYWQSVKTLLKDIYEMNEHTLKPIGDNDDEEDALEDKSDEDTRTDGADADSNKRKRELEDEGARAPPHHHTGDAVVQPLPQARENARSGATTPPVVDAEQDAVGEDVVEEGQSKVSYYCTGCTVETENADELNEWTDFVDTVLLTNDADMPGDELQGGSVQLDTMSKRYAHLMRSLLSVPTDKLGYSVEEEVHTNTVAASSTLSSVAASTIPSTSTASTPSTATCGANLRESTCNMLNDFMVWLDEQIGEAQELERSMVAGPSADGGMDGMSEYNGEAHDHPGTGPMFYM